MNATPPPLPDGFTAESDLHGGWRISRGGVFVGQVFPRLPGEPDGLWYARLYGKPARPCRNRQAAVDRITQHLTGENPKAADSCTCRAPASKCDGHCSGNWTDPDCSWHGRPVQPDPACPVHQGRRARGPKPPPVGEGCICDGSGRTCPRHGAVI